MKTKEKMIGSVPGNILGMASDLFHKLQHGKIKPIELGLFLKRKNPFGVSAALADWQRFYRDFFGIKTDFSSIEVPETCLGFDRLIVIAKNLSPNQAFDVCQQKFPCWRYTEDLNEATKDRNDREATQDYAIWVRDRQEADEELKNLTVDQLKEKGIKGITLLERIIFELKFWDEIGKHLDEKSITYCYGSRLSGGRVPRAGWRGGGFRVAWFGVYWSSPRRADSALRARAVVSS
jgi:hypothetical protein